MSSTLPSSPPKSKSRAKITVRSRSLNSSSKRLPPGGGAGGAGRAAVSTEAGGSDYTGEVCGAAAGGAGAPGGGGDAEAGGEEAGFCCSCAEGCCLWRLCRARDCISRARLAASSCISRICLWSRSGIRIHLQWFHSFGWSADYVELGLVYIEKHLGLAIKARAERPCPAEEAEGA